MTTVRARTRRPRLAQAAISIAPVRPAPVFGGAIRGDAPRARPRPLARCGLTIRHFSLATAGVHRRASISALPAAPTSRRRDRIVCLTRCPAVSPKSPAPTRAVRAACKRRARTRRRPVRRHELRRSSVRRISRARCAGAGAGRPWRAARASAWRDLHASLGARAADWPLLVADYDRRALGRRARGWRACRGHDCRPLPPLRDARRRGVRDARVHTMRISPARCCSCAMRSIVSTRRRGERRAHRAQLRL